MWRLIASTPNCDGPQMASESGLFQRIASPAVIRSHRRSVSDAVAYGSAGPGNVRTPDMLGGGGHSGRTSTTRSRSVGAPRRGHRRNGAGGSLGSRSAQLLLSLAPAEEAECYEADIPDGFQPHCRDNPISKFLDRHLVWKSDSSECNDKSRKEFCTRPSWCDADMCMQQIKWGKAEGNKWALYSRSFIQKALYSLGASVQRHAWWVIAIICILFAMCCYGLQFVRIETDIVKLWVAQGGRLDEELHFLERMKQDERWLSNATAGNEPPRESGLGGGYQVLIQTNHSLLNREQLLQHVDLINQIAQISVEKHGTNWTLSDLCFKPSITDDTPEDEQSMGNQLVPLIRKIIPCIWITPIDCFWDGSRPLGPYPAVKYSELGAARLLSSIPNGPLRWTTLDPHAVIEEVRRHVKMGSHFDFFQRTGIGHGYQDRPCIDPLDAECPSMAPNYWNACAYLGKFDQYANRTGIELALEEVEPEESTSVFDILFDGFRRRRDVSSANNSTLPGAQKHNLTDQDYCKRIRGPLMRWMRQNEDKWELFLKENELPREPDYGAIMAGGCRGFAKAALNWPQDMIVGGVHKRLDGSIERAEALQSVFLVASPADLHSRFSKLPKTGLNQSAWSEQTAEEVLLLWQRNFTQLIYKHEMNFETDPNTGYRTENRRIHPLAATSIADMLEEFCQFNYTIIFVGYGLMLVYAMVTQLRTRNSLPSAESSVGLAFVGVLVVTFASVAGLGLATWFGIEFNAATTQIVPFLTLGIGVDNMFMLLHSLHAAIQATNSRQAELGVLLRETGMSILMTSTNNILSFLAGTLLPIPALRSFCAQSSVLLTFNFVAMLTLFPAIIAIDLKRRRAGRRDVLCCLTSPEEVGTYGTNVQMIEDKAYSIIDKTDVQMGDESCELSKIKPEDAAAAPAQPVQPAEEDYVPPEEEYIAPHSLRAFLRNYYIPIILARPFRIFVLLFTACLLVLSVYGMKRAQMGLELSDVLPAHTAPAAFLRARDRYFSFYPMMIVIKGPDIDYAAKQQRRIDNLREKIGALPYVVKNSQGEPSEKYWLGLMRNWLVALQKAYEREVLLPKNINPETGDIRNVTAVSDEARLAHRLLCSVGSVYNCTGRADRVQLVENSGMIDAAGFYNFLTAWVNHDDMMYYVSQASFFPHPPQWKLEDSNKTSTLSAARLLVPPAQPLVYSQMPFYLTGLTDTPTIVKMIEQVRSVCDDFSESGLPNFPSGIAFTFWEQYLFLATNLAHAVAIIALAVFVVISLLLFNPWAAACVFVVLVVMTIQLTGFLGLFGVKMNPVSAVTIITAVGIGVEFTAHVVLAFLTSLGGRDRRVAQSIDRVFVPVIHGALSTMLGIVMLAFSEFEFVVKYFFVVMFALIIIGLLNGLVLLPVLLAMFGPPTEIASKDGSEHLRLPPPLERKRRAVEHLRRKEAVNGKRRENGTIVTPGTSSFEKRHHKSASTAIEQDNARLTHRLEDDDDEGGISVDFGARGRQHSRGNTPKPAI